jgi:hypothetical protein
MTKAKWAAMIAEHDTFLRSHTPRPSWDDDDEIDGFDYNPQHGSHTNAEVSFSTVFLFCILPLTFLSPLAPQAMCKIIKNTNDENKSFTLMEERAKFDEMQTELRSTVFALKKATKRKTLEDNGFHETLNPDLQKAEFSRNTDFVTDNGRYFIGMGHSDNIPKFLRSIGHIPLTLISLSDLLVILADIWESFGKKRKVCTAMISAVVVAQYLVLLLLLLLTS